MNWRRWLLVLLVIGFFLLVIVRRVEIGELMRILRKAQWQWLIAVFLLQGLYYFIYTLLYSLAFRIVRVKARLFGIFKVLLSSLFVNNLAPSAGLGGAAVFIDEAVQKGESGARTAEGVLLVTLLEHLAVIPVLVVGLVALFSLDILGIYWILAIAVFFLFILTLLTALFLGRWSPSLLRGALQRLQNNLNRVWQKFFGQEWLDSKWANQNTIKFGRAGKQIATQPFLVGGAFGLALTLAVVNLISLFLVFFSFGQAVGLTALAAGYSLGFVLSAISFLPLDAALMQATMLLVYESLGVSSSSALAVVLVFGGINFWLPLIVGLFFLGQIKTFGGK